MRACVSIPRIYRLMIWMGIFCGMELDRNSFTGEAARKES